MEEPDSNPVRRFRKASLGLKQCELAARVGASAAKLSRIENGEQDPDMAFLRLVVALSDDEQARVDLIKGLLGEAA